MSGRTLALDIYTRLKAATGQLIKGGFGHQIEAAKATRVGQQTLSDYASRSADKAESFVPVDVFADLLVEGRDLTLLRLLAELAGCLLIPLPKGTGAGLLAEGTGRTAKEIGEVMMRIGEAMGDGRIDESERAAIRQEILEAIVSLASLSEAVDRAALEGRT